MTRIRDVVVAALMLLVLSPFLLILVVLIRLDSPGPALYRQVHLEPPQHVFPCRASHSWPREIREQSQKHFHVNAP